MWPYLMAAGLAKSMLIDKPKEEHQRKVEATKALYSPWTGIGAGQVKEADPFGSAMQGAMMGMAMDQNMERTAQGKELLASQQKNLAAQTDLLKAQSNMMQAQPQAGASGQVMSTGPAMTPQAQPQFDPGGIWGGISTQASGVKGPMPAVDQSNYVMSRSPAAMQEEEMKRMFSPYGNMGRMY